MSRWRVVLVYSHKWRCNTPIAQRRLSSRIHYAPKQIEPPHMDMRVCRIAVGWVRIAANEVACSQVCPNWRSCRRIHVPVCVNAGGVPHLNFIPVPLVGIVWVFPARFGHPSASDCVYLCAGLVGGRRRSRALPRHPGWTRAFRASSASAGRLIRHLGANAHAAGSFTCDCGHHVP